MTSSGDCPSSLAAEIYEAVEAIKTSLNQASLQRKYMREKSVVARNQVQDDVSVHLELLRNREVWLLEQVGMLAEMKEETFECHVQELRNLLAKLEVYQQMLEAVELHENSEVLVQVREILSVVQHGLLTSEEASDIYFDCDNFALADAVKNFGRIVEGEPAGSARKCSRSFKKGFEPKVIPLNVAFIREHFENVSRSPQNEWLMSGTVDVPEVVRRSNDYIRKYFEELKTADKVEWLCQEAELMDVDATSNRFRLHFQQVKGSPASEWLRPAANTDPCDTPSWFAHLDTSENITAWLLRPLQSLSLSSKMEEVLDEGISMSRQSSVESKNSNQRELQKIEQLIDGENEWLLKAKLIEECVSPLKPDAPTTDEALEANSWLLHGTCASSEAQIIQHESWLKRFQESCGSSTSDWLIASEVEPEYCEWLTQESIERCKSCPGECARDTFGVFRNVLRSTRSEWLATASDW